MKYQTQQLHTCPKLTKCEICSKLKIKVVERWVDADL